MLLDDQNPDDVGPGSFTEPAPRRLAGVLGPINWRVGIVVGLALLTGAGATLATSDLGGDEDAESAATRVEAEDRPTTASTVGGQAASPELRQAEGGLDPLGLPDGDGTAATEEASTADASSSTDSSTTTTDGTSTSGDGTSPPPSTSPGGSTSTTADGTSSSARATTVTGRTSTTRGATTTRATNTSRATTTTRRTTTTTRATTTTRPTTSTTRATTTQAGNSCATGAEFELIMRDDFNGSSLGGNWFLWDQSPGNANNGRRMASTVSVGNGVVTIRAEMVNGTLYSGGFEHRATQTYGKYRFRVRTDVDPSRVMSGVVLTWPASDNHPYDGENNIYETLPHEVSATRDPFYTFIHKPKGSSSDQERKVWHADAAQWQTMTMEWTPDRVVVQRDGGETWTLNETGADLIPDVAHQLAIQFDATNQSISGPLTMQVDFAEVYRYCG